MTSVSETLLRHDSGNDGQTVESPCCQKLCPADSWKPSALWRWHLPDGHSPQSISYPDFVIRYSMLQLFELMPVRTGGHSP